MAVYKNKFVLEAERMVKVGKYVAKECEFEWDPLVRQIIATGVSDKEAYQDLKKLKNSTADYEEINVAVLEAVAKNTFQKQSEFELPTHKQKKELFLETEDSVSSAKNASAAKELFEGRKNYKELVNDLNYPRGLDEQTRYKKISVSKEMWAWSSVDKAVIYKHNGKAVASTAIVEALALGFGGWEPVEKKYPYHKVEKGKPYVVTINNNYNNATKKYNAATAKQSKTKFNTYYVVYLTKVDKEGIFDNRLDTWYKMPYYGKANHLGQLHILEGGPLHCPVKLGAATSNALAALAKSEKAEDDCGAKCEPIKGGNCKVDGSPCTSSALCKSGQCVGEENPDYDHEMAKTVANKVAMAKAAVAAAKSDKIYAPRFVALAFREFQKSYNKRASTDQLSPKSKFLKIIEPKKGYQNKIRAYEAFLTGIKEDFFADVLGGLEDSKKIKNIDDFNELLMAYLEEIDEPITMVGYFEKYLDIYMTGLAVDIHNGDSSSDQEKIDFLEDPNYPVYAYLAAKSGFKIDPNVPWRLIADVRTGDMQKKINEALKADDSGNDYALDGADVTMSVFKHYNSVVNDDANEIEFYVGDEWPLNHLSFNSWGLALQQWYEDFVSANPHYVIVESTLSGTKVTKKMRSLLSWPGDPGAGSLIFYVRVRNYECKNALSAFKLKILEKTITSFEAPALLPALDMIETMLGTYAARNLPLEQKALTKIEKSWIMIPSFTKYL